MTGLEVETKYHSTEGEGKVSDHPNAVLPESFVSRRKEGSPSRVPPKGSHQTKASTTDGATQGFGGKEESSGASNHDGDQIEVASSTVRPTSRPLELNGAQEESESCEDAVEPDEA